MNLKDEMLHDLAETILWALIISYIILIWRMPTSTETIIYIESKPEITDQTLKTENIDPIYELGMAFNELPVLKIEPQYGFTEDEIYLMAVLLSGSKYVDGDGEYDIDFDEECDQEQINLVLSVVMNRVASDQFPNTVSEIIWAPGQFSPMTKWANGLPEVSNVSLNKVREWCRAYDTYDSDCQTIPDNHLYFYGNGTVNISRERWYN